MSVCVWFLFFASQYMKVPFESIEMLLTQLPSFTIKTNIGHLKLRSRKT